MGGGGGGWGKLAFFYPPLINVFDIFPIVVSASLLVFCGKERKIQEKNTQISIHAEGGARGKNTRSKMGSKENNFVKNNHKSESKSRTRLKLKVFSLERLWPLK